MPSMQHAPRGAAGQVTLAHELLSPWYVPPAAAQPDAVVMKQAGVPAGLLFAQHAPRGTQRSLAQAVLGPCHVPLSAAQLA